MRMCSITLPIADNDGVNLADVHAAMQAQLCADYGGFTAVNARGAWADNGRTYFEDVIVYIVANGYTVDATVNLRSIARFYGHMAKQRAMFLTFGASAEIVEIETAAQNATVTV